jgi:hypothetical protein
MAKQDFADHILPEDPDELARNLDTAERAQMWINALQAYALEQLQRQVRVPGWELVPTRPTRRWNDEDPVTAASLVDTGVTVNEVWETKLRSPAQLEKTLIRSARGREIWNNRIAPFLVENKSSGVKLARTRNSDAPGEFEDAD